MKTLKTLSKKAIEFCNYSNICPDTVKKVMKLNGFEFQKCETKDEMLENGVDFNYPYVIFNPHGYYLKEVDRVETIDEALNQIRDVKLCENADLWEDNETYYVDLHHGLGATEYPKADYTLQEVTEDICFPEVF